jgi:UDP-glucose 4-epimerase
MSDQLGPVLVTGASGFIGSTLVASLQRSGVEVRGVDLVPSRDPELDLVVGDLRDPDVVDEALARRPVTVFHLAARTSVLRSMEDPDGVFGVNVAATQQLLERGRHAGVQSFVLASTNAVAGASDGAVIDERTPMLPLTPYGATKAAGEMLCSAYAGAYGMAACAVRLTNVYGPAMGGKDTFVIRLLRAAATGAPATVYGDGDQVRDYLYVDDAVAGMRLAADRRLTGAMVLGTGHSTSVLELCRLAEATTGGAIARTGVPAPKGEMRAVRVDPAYAHGVGWTPTVMLPEGLARTWAHLQPQLTQEPTPSVATGPG